MRQNLRILFIATVATLIGTNAMAQALGYDAVTRQMERLDLFTPHGDDCDTSTEAFLPLQGATRGLCIEKSIRSADTWINARKTCLAINKRLPEASEFLDACLNVAGLSSMTSSWQWVSNYAFNQYFADLSGDAQMMVPLMGASACKNTSWSNAGSSIYSLGSFQYRCIR